MAMRQEVNAPLIWTIGIVSGLLLVIVGIGVEAWFRFEERAETAAKSQGAVYAPLAELHERQLKDLSGYGWVSEGQGNQARPRPVIPLEEAEALLIRLGGKMPATRPATQPTAMNVLKPEEVR